MGFSFDDVHRFEEQFEKLDNTYNTVQLILSKVDQLGEQMGTLAEGLTSLSDALTGLETDVARVLAALGSPGVTLDTEAQAAVDALAARMGTMDAAMDTAVPETPTP
jgi:hypothetical protein